ncbi:NhaA family Na+:H+ antiporter [Pedobacter sp. UYP30]|uniref:Na+/H+ antiporter NhaA n=1 Tax=Pedobacter sp. UYP30 TaxID=1756400 RepID=UPI00339826DE
MKKILNPLKLLINDTRFTGVMLIVCTLLSLFLANSANLESIYKNIWSSTWVPENSTISLPENFKSLINNFLMAFFFLMAGMEIRRELISGELSTFKKASLPFGAALGGMVVPALVFLAFNIHTEYANGWGIPTATDIAFSLGIASLLGKRVPIALKVLLMALAIIDDLGAILVIALFYGEHLNLIFLSIAGLLFSSLLFLNYLKVKFGAIHVVLSLLLWLAIFNSGIEASIAGVLVAFALPINILPKIEGAIHGYVNFLILPLFALANTAILLPKEFAKSLESPLAMGIIAGLVIGKPLGIFLFSRLMVAFKLANLPKNTSWNQIIGMGVLAGIGFTMSIFTGMLAFKNEQFQNIAKVAIIVGVAVSLIISVVYFFVLGIKKVALKGRIFKINQSAFSENLASRLG